MFTGSRRVPIFLAAYSFSHQILHCLGHTRHSGKRGHGTAKGECFAPAGHTSYILVHCTLPCFTFKNSRIRGSASFARLYFRAVENIRKVKILTKNQVHDSND